MVHINQVELTHFKSFGGSLAIPLDDGFTVVTGPNGSGKSNILDAVLFCLGLANSRGMRAERLPDLINSTVMRAGKAAEASVTVHFELGDWQPDEAEKGLDAPPEGPWIQAGQHHWSVTRRLRVAPGGTYTSSYSAGGVPCNLQQLQTQLRRLRVDPDGSNVVMQGDVTRIVSMSARERRGIIDELAGVALFDSRIDQSRSKLDEVQERQERCRIVEQELLNSRQKLERDCAKARLYQDLRQRLQRGRDQEQVLAWEEASRQRQRLQDQATVLVEKQRLEEEAIHTGQEVLDRTATELEALQVEVKALGEDQLLAVQSDLAGLEASGRELARQGDKHRQEAEALQEQRQTLAARQGDLHRQGQELARAGGDDALAVAEQACRDAEGAVELSRRRLGEVAGRSGSWMDEQRRRSEERRSLRERLAPLEAERQQRQERCRQAAERLAELEAERQAEGSGHEEMEGRLAAQDQEALALQEELEREQTALQELVEGFALQQRTRQRLEQEQTGLEREIARLDSRRETLQESRGTGALRVLLESGLEGIHGPVAQLGEVQERHRIALEVAAGGIRGGGGGGAGGAALQRGAAPGGAPATQGGGLVGRAVELVRHEPVYDEVFRYVFGETLVFATLEQARRELGRCRAVTLEGELLEKSGAMTGGSLQVRSGQLGFGSSQEGDEAEPLRRRLLELGESLLACRRREADLGRQLEERRPALQGRQQRRAALEAERGAARRALEPLLQRGRQLQERHQSLLASHQEDNQRLEELGADLLPLQAALQALEAAEASASGNADGGHWQALQQDLESADHNLSEARQRRDVLVAERRERALAAERLSSQLEAVGQEEQRLGAAITVLMAERQAWRERQQAEQERRASLEARQSELTTRFGERRRARDIAEAQLGA
ncbi:MAG: AAA family ATPase, partial [Cyanobacteria bacterium]|nr:AAA family ATPase [Cyanobacteriota bacterium]